MKLPYAEVRIDGKGAWVEPDDVDGASDLLATHAATDVLILCHGWNNTPGDARALYERLVTSIVAVRDAVPGSRRRQFAVVGAIWPSIQWAPPENSGAGAGADGPAEALRSEIETMVTGAAARRRLLALVDRLEHDPDAAVQFVEVLRTTLPRSTKGEDAAAFRIFRSAPALEVIEAVRGGADETAPAAVGGAAVLDLAAPPEPVDGGGAGLFSSLIDAARNALNIATYYTMKERAGVVGRKGIARLLERLHADHPQARLHLVGHSFGGRAVTAAADAARAPVSSLTLLQAAFSHFGMARNWDGAGTDGLFAGVPAKVEGPILVTFTRNDTAVGLAYAIASRLARQIGAAIGDENDPYGGIGRNGALKTPASLPPGKLRAVGGAYDFPPGRVASLNADSYITGHSDVTGRQVAYALLRAVDAPG
ncbi:alpha/beta fold hydrolase [Microbacterium sp. T2.11-28]|uniref:alpha/beta fold hydrolase n=1 Tax=Microbacterium sp. T2.11-28 TaxID=3041169 RepID=UPI002477916B|nr:alpha/beta fold hydrolase [Microbacterium sp. T2.11-28]CAI9386584.1 hypothetical protein MICABA_00472 [Microbacterium sp. T2.11-28]